MKIYLSWSGTLSREVAGLFVKYLPRVSASFDVWSSESIEVGMSWETSIREELEKCDLIIMIITNTNSPWMIFEAGIAHSLGKRLIPITIGMTPSDLQGPIALFQAINAQSPNALKNFIITLLEQAGEPNNSRHFSIEQWEMVYPSFHAELDKLLKEEAASRLVRNKDKARAIDAFDKAWSKNND